MQPTPARMAQAPEYPFVPKSNRWLEPGQFWGVPLRSGRHACGRVLLSPGWRGVRTTFIGG